MMIILPECNIVKFRNYVEVTQNQKESLRLKNICFCMFFSFILQLSHVYAALVKE